MNQPRNIVEEDFTWNIPNFDIACSYSNKFDLGGQEVILDLLRDSEQLKCATMKDGSIRIYFSQLNFYFNNIPQRKSFKFSVKTEKGGKKCERDFLEIKQGTLGLSTKETRLLRSGNSIRACLEKGTLTLLIKLAIRDAIESDDLPLSPSQHESTEKDQVSSEAPVKLTEENSNFTFVVEESEQLAIKSVVEANSTVLAKIIVDAGADSKAVVEDITLKNFSAVMSFIHAKAIKIVGISMLQDLLVAAEKFKVKGLKSECEKYAIQTLSRESAVMLYELASKHQLSELKNKISSFSHSSLRHLSDILFQKDIGTIDDTKEVFDMLIKIENVIKALPRREDYHKKPKKSSKHRQEDSRRLDAKKTESLPEIEKSSGSSVVRTRLIEKNFVISNPKNDNEKSGTEIFSDNQKPVTGDDSTSSVAASSLVEKNVIIPKTSIDEKPEPEVHSENQKPASGDFSKNTKPSIKTAEAKTSVGGNRYDNLSAGKREPRVPKRRAVLDPAEILGDYYCEFFDEIPIKQDTEPKEKLGSFRDFMSSLT